MKSLVCVVCGLQFVSCAVFSLCYVQSSTCVMCSLQSVLCAVSSLCHVQSSACAMYSLQSRTSSLRSEHTSPRSVWKSQTRAQGKRPRQCQISNVVCRAALHGFCAQNTYTYIYIYIYIYVLGSSEHFARAQWLTKLHSGIV